MINLVFLTNPCLQNLGKTQTWVFPVSGFLISSLTVNSHNSRTSNDIDIKLEPVTKLDKRSTTTSKKLYDSVMLGNCDVIVIFQIYDQFGAIRTKESGRFVCNTYIFIISNLISYKNENRTKKSLTQLSYYCNE